jgi:hypothetical protein
MRGRWLGWLVIGVVGATLVSLAVAHAPAPVRKLVLFPVLFGLACGWGLGRLALEFRLRPSWAGALLAALLVTGGLVNVAVVSFRQVAAEARRSVQQDPQRLLGLPLLEDQARHDPVWAQRYREEKLKLRPGFGDYLAGRVARFGWWRDPWPAVFWGAELLLAALAAGWTFSCVARGADGPLDEEGRAESFPV